MKETKQTKIELINKINKKLNRLSTDELLIILEESNKINKKQEKKERISYTSIPAIVKVEGKKYHTIMFRPKIVPDDYFKQFRFVENKGNWIKVEEKVK